MTTDDPDLAARLKRLRVHGDVGGYNHVEVGFNSRVDSLQAAVLRVKLKHLEKWSDKRRQNAARYDMLLQDSGVTDTVIRPVTGSDQRHVFNQYTLRIKNGLRDAVMNQMRAQGVGCAVYYPIPLHMQKCFDYLGYQADDFPESNLAAQEVLSLPIFSEMTEQQQNRVVEVLVDAASSATTLKLPATQAQFRKAA